MQAHEIEVMIPADHRLMVEVPQSVRSGPAKLILLVPSDRQHLTPPQAQDPAVAQASSLEDLIGVLDSREHIPGGAQMSEECGIKFAAGLLEKHRAGERCH
jgi:hypothetical protein